VAAFQTESCWKYIRGEYNALTAVDFDREVEADMLSERVCLIYKMEYF
jgi:hypothetical protein